MPPCLLLSPLANLSFPPLLVHQSIRGCLVFSHCFPLCLQLHLLLDLPGLQPLRLCPFHIQLLLPGLLLGQSLLFRLGRLLLLHPLRLLSLLPLQFLHPGSMFLPHLPLDRRVGLRHDLLAHLPQDLVVQLLQPLGLRVQGRLGLDRDGRRGLLARPCLSPGPRRVRPGPAAHLRLAHELCQLQPLGVLRLAAGLLLLLLLLHGRPLIYLLLLLLLHGRSAPRLLLLLALHGRLPLLRLSLLRLQLLLRLCLLHRPLLCSRPLGLLGA
mmetsp:Transcript_98187/g.293313  ORF Transcript_98187/g.293313 Transcript_98187/m.293313 type:complete len:268 (-) Transcript_98187:316-1119(-)